jgi:hypothetical protein
MQQSKYWDLNTFQKAALTWDEIQAFRKVELMIQGVAFPEEPEASKNLPSFHEFAKGHEQIVTVVRFGYNDYQISEEDREKLLLINFNRLGSNYINGESVHYIDRGEKPEIKAVPVYPAFTTLYEKYDALYGDAVKRKAEWERYQKDLDAANKATLALTEDWQQSQESVATYELVKRVFDEYVVMAEGNVELAKGFLEKRFDYQQMQIFNELSRESEQVA